MLLKSLTLKITKGLLITAAASSFGLFNACSMQKTEATTTAKPGDLPTMVTEDPEIGQALAMINKVPDSPKGYDALAVIFIKRARLTGDFSLNAKAETAITKALEIAPADDISRKLRASLFLTYHKFDEALALANELQQAAPTDAFIYGILTDANVELGNYEDAVASAQKMIDLRPNSSSYARVAHLRSLYGDSKGAVEMFKLAARTADPADPEAQSWCIAQLGDEYWKYGKYADAERTYDEALTILPNYYLALVGKGRARASQNDLTGAAELLSTATNRIPNVEATILLGNIYQKLGDMERARQQYELVEVIEAKIGVNNDQKRLAVLWADQEMNLDRAIEITKRESGMRRDIFTADALAWTLYKTGAYAEAKAAITDALRLKTNDARILYHAGMIEKSLGNNSEANRQLIAAVKLNPAFDLIQADLAKTALAEIK